MLVSVSSPAWSCCALVQRVDGEIRRDGIESARVHDAGAGVDGLLVVQVDAFADEHRLTRQIGVVGSRGGARGNQGQPVLEVRPHGRHHHLRLGRQRIQRRRLRSVRGDQRPRLRALPQRVPDSEQFVLRPAGQRDAGISARACQIFCGQLADEAGRSVHDDVELTLRCAHGATLPERLGQFDVLTQHVTGQEDNHDLVPDLGMLRSEYPVVLRREVEESVRAGAVRGCG